MADLNVQPKKKSPLLWIIAVIALIILLFLLLRGCGDNTKTTSGSGDSTVVAATTNPEWDSVDFNLPAAGYDEVTDTGIQVRGNEHYSVYGLGENVLFATDSSAIQSTAWKQLEQIAASLKKRYNGASIAVFGSTDSTGTAGHNAELGEQRAASVKTWLIEQAGISKDQISVHSKGQEDPVASNGTQAGRQQNRSVQIVAMKAN